jgi:hypothetical protein
MIIVNDFPISKENIEAYCNMAIVVRDNLNALQLCSEKYNEFKSELSSYNGNLDDLLHQITLDSTTDSQKVKLINKLSEVKAEQTAVKDFIEVFLPIKEWLSKNYYILDELKSAINKTIKNKDRQVKRRYVYRTNIVKETLNKED